MMVIAWPTSSRDCSMPDAVTTISSPRSLSAVSAKAGAAIASVSKDMVANFNMERPRTPATKAERSEEHTSELQSLMRISYAVFCLKKKRTIHQIQHHYDKPQKT